MDDQTKRNQIRKTFQALHGDEPLTRLQVAQKTGIRRANVCWYIRHFRKRNQVAVVRKGIDPITRHPAEFLTTNPDLFPDDPQTDMFGGSDE
ncbi:hypothetical protein [Fodinibius salsisoli]|uniref:Helix-turn-helix transcriptional regulator n=1 Tax=Fodinibius salsisoli TaxID=2820877 RepID=A0ABT3PQE4_9BACT|nr:hypothetical protein [Fodinibius salsisoli]MCW9708087.1 helix-turn-helix transcriptional regulator [Fodinibius salsisoli]